MPKNTRAKSNLIDCKWAKVNEWGLNWLFKSLGERRGYEGFLQQTKSFDRLPSIKIIENVGFFK
jgi:hypothetical protein